MNTSPRLAAAACLVALAPGCASSITPRRPAPDDAPAAYPVDAATARDAPRADVAAPPDAPAPAATDNAQPPPLAGGTLAVTRDGATAIVSDPDGDRVLLVDLARRAVTAVALRPGDEPGRVVEDGAGRAFVALRGGAAVLTVALASGAVQERRAVCPHPRGLAWDGARGVLHVACMGGELVTLPPVGVAGARRAQLDRDLRDVAVAGDRLLVTRLRSAEVLVVDDRGVVTQRIAATAPAGSQAGVARRMIPAPGGGVWLLHQRAGNAPIAVSTTGYRDTAVTCAGTDGITRPALVRVRPPFAPELLPDIPSAPLAVDVAVDASGASLALAVPGAFGSERPQVVRVAATARGCLTPTDPWSPPRGQAVAVAFTAGGRLLVQTRAPATVQFVGDAAAIALGGPEPRNVGHGLFHTNPTGAVTCASCHIEGEDDGRVWTFAPEGPRRTPHLRGGLLGTEPFHWSGDLRDFRALVASVLVGGMRAPAPSDAGIDSLARWIDRLPRRAAPPSDASAVARGEALFRSAATNCTSCHAGPHFSNGATVDVGTGGAFQVPPLHGLAWHAPYLHHGCAATLRERFGPCGGGDRHGRTSQLTSAQVGDLVAYLETL